METETKTIQVLDGWHEVTIGQYQEIASLDVENQTDKMIEIVSILTNEDSMNTRKMDLTSLNRIIQHLAWSNKLPDDAVYKPIIVIDGFEYGFISRLTDLSVGEWIDLEHYLADLNNNLHRIFAILYRPLVTAFNDSDRILENYDSAMLESRAQLFSDKVMITDVYGAFVFFSIIVKESMLTIQDYLINQVAEMEMTNLEMSLSKRKNNVLHTSWKRIKKPISGCGILMRTSYVGVMLQRWKQYLKPISS